MATESTLPVARLHLLGAEELRRRWGWFLALGILLVVLGTIALGSTFFLTIASVLVFGWLMIVGGILQAGHSFFNREWGGFFVELLSGLLYLVVGGMMVANPGASAVALTLLIAVFLILGGIFRIVAGAAIAYQNRAWLILHGAVNLLLGVAIWSEWPLSGLWVIGLFVGIDMLFNGWSLIMLAFAARRLPGGSVPMRSGAAE